MPDTQPGAPFPHGLLRAFLSLGIAAIVITLLILAQSLLVPLAIALGLLVLINAATARIAIGAFIPPYGLRLTITLLVFGLALLLVGLAVGSGISGVVDSVPEYQRALERAASALGEAIGFDIEAAATRAIEGLNVGEALGTVVGIVSDVASPLGFVLVFLFFLILEQSNFARKLRGVAGSREHASDARDVLKEINHQITRYIATKTFLAATIGLAAFVTLTIAEVNGAAFWGFLTFLLDFIPTIGSLGGVLLAVLATLAAHEDPSAALTVGAVLGGLQVIQGNLVEPRLMSRSLNLSPLAVIVALAVWGLIWGPIGLFLGVPLTAALAIIFAAFEETRWVAVLLSDDGRVEGG